MKTAKIDRKKAIKLFRNLMNLQEKSTQTAIIAVIERLEKEENFALNMHHTFPYWDSEKINTELEWQIVKGINEIFKEIGGKYFDEAIKNAITEIKFKRRQAGEERKLLSVEEIAEIVIKPNPNKRQWNR